MLASRWALGKLCATVFAKAGFKLPVQVVSTGSRDI